MLTELPSVKIYCKNLCAGFNDQNNQRWKDWIAIIPSWMADQIQSVAHMSFDRFFSIPPPFVVRNCLSIDSCKEAFSIPPPLLSHSKLSFTFIAPQTSDCLSFIATWGAFVNGEIVNLFNFSTVVSKLAQIWIIWIVWSWSDNRT